jgi:hypothetical protein
MRVSEHLSQQPIAPQHAYAPPLSAVRTRSLHIDRWLLRHARAVGVILWLCLVAIYQLDDSLVEEGDAIANIELPITLLRTGRLHFTPRLTPIVFNWRSLPPLEERNDFYVRSWRERHAGKAAGYWYATGRLTLNGSRYFVVKSPLRDQYVCTFGVIAGLSMLPMAALLALVHPDFVRSEWLKLSAAKLHASGLIALSAVLLFWIALRFVRPRHALLIAGAYALGTCVWSVSSETLWQQTVNIALLSGVAYSFVRIVLDDSKPARVVCGLLLGAAVASRPTAVFYLITIAMHLFWQRRHALQTVLLTACIAPVAVCLYNEYYFGSPINFAQELAGHQIAIEKTGIEGIWQTPLVVGLAGLLISPSRGLLVFSPFLLAGLWGARQLWQRSELTPLRPLLLAAAATMLLQCKWFDWWGGWAFGYRPWLEAMPVLALCLVATIEPILKHPVTALLFCVALGWSVFVQSLGAFAYDKYWNARDLHRVSHGEEARFFLRERDARAHAAASGGTYAGLFACNIDLPACRYRVWSLEDNVIGFYMGERFRVARENRVHAGMSELFGSP